MSLAESPAMSDEGNIVSFPRKQNSVSKSDQDTIDFSPLSSAVQELLKAIHGIAHAVADVPLTNGTRQEFLRQITSLTAQTSCLYLTLAREVEGTDVLVERVKAVMSDLEKL